MTSPLELIVWHNSLLTWLIALGTGAGTFVALQLVQHLIRGRLTRLAERSAVLWDDVVVHALSRTKKTAIVVVALFAASSFLSIPPRQEVAFGRLLAIVVLIQIGIWVSGGLSFWLTGYTKRRLSTDPGVATTISALGFVGKLVVWVVLLLVALDTVGIDVTALVAGLGIGGVAVALATQNILGDIFASLSIVLDKPFVLGDFIIVGELMGNVEHIGLKTTRIRSLWGERLVFSNSDLLGSRIRNFGAMKERRIVIEIGTTYQTPRAQVERVPGMLRVAIEAESQARFDRAHFKAFGPYALTFEMVYYVLTGDFNAHMDVQQRILLRVFAEFEREGIEFAYPTQQLFLTRAPVRDVGVPVGDDIDESAMHRSLLATDGRR